MSRATRERNCPYGPTGRRYRPQREKQLAVDDKLDLLFQELSEALEAVDGPLEAGRAGLTVDDLVSGLQVVPRPARADFFKSLGLSLSPAKVGQVMARDALNRLRRADGHDLRHACVSLTFPLGSSVLSAALNFGPEDKDTAERRLAASSRAFRQITVWANAQCSALGARIWVWAASQPWFAPAGVDPASIDRVVAAATALVDATPEFEAGLEGLAAENVAEEDLAVDDVSGCDEGSSGSDVDAPGGDQPASADASPELDDPAPALPTGSGQQEDDVPEPAQHAQPDEERWSQQDTAPATPEVTQVLTQGLEKLESLVASATQAAAAVVKDLSFARALKPEHVQTVAACASGFAALGVAFVQARIEVPDISVDGFRTALDDYRRQSDDQPVRASLVRLGQLTAPPGQELLRPHLASATDRSAALLAARSWTPDERAEAQTLALLVSLASPDSMSSAELSTKQNQVVSAYPELALLAIRAAVLVPAPDQPAAAEEDPAAEADTTAGADTADAGDPAAEVEHPPADPTDDEPAVPERPGAGAAATNSSTPGSGPSAGSRAPNGAAAGPSPSPSGASIEDDAPHTSPAADSPTANFPLAGESTDPAKAAGRAPATPGVSQGAAPRAQDQIDDERPLPSAEQPQTPSGRPEDIREPVREALAGLIEDQRFALAAELARSSGTTAPGPAVLTVSALAAAVRTPNGRVSAAIKAQLPSLGTSSLTDTTSLLLAVPALLRVALVTGDSFAGALLLDVEPHLEQHLATLAREVGKRAVEGVLLSSPPLTWTPDAASSEEAIAAAAAEATEQLRTRRLRYKRASDIANAWLSPEGFVGRPLSVVRDDDRSKLAEVRDALAVLSDSSAVNRQIETDDSHTRSTSNKTLQGPAVGNLVSIAAEALNPLSQWVAAVEADQNSDRRTSWSSGEIAAMRSAIHASAPGAVEALALTAAGDDVLVAAAADAAVSSLQETVDLLDGAVRRDALELSVPDVLGLDLLHVAGARVDAASSIIDVPRDLDVADFTAAATRTWEDSVRLHVEQENFAAAHRIVRAAQSQILTGPDDGRVLSDELVELVGAREDSASADVQQLLAELGAALRDARLNNQISEEQDAELTAQLSDAARDPERDPDAPDSPGAVRVILDSIRSKLPHYLQEASTRLRDKLSAAAAQSKVTGADVERVSAFIDRGDLGTAEELIYLLQTNETLPSQQPHDDLRHFFPAVPDALPDGLSRALVSAVRNRQVVPSCPVLDFSELSSNVAELNADALESWMKLGATSPGLRYQVSEHDLLMPALRVLGIESKKIDQPDHVSRHRDRKFVDIREVTVNGKAMVPAFGSNAGDRRRILLVWGQPPVDTLMSYVDQDPAEGPLIVAYFGTMSVQARKDLAVRSLRSNAPVVVLDDAALAYLAARGGRLFESTMRILLPFAHVNPYIRQKRGLVAEEMFYGRGDERRQVLDKDGTQIVYGGRGLGKSALLHNAEAKFEQGGLGDRVAIYMSLDALGIGSGNALAAAAVWDALLQQLVDRGVASEKKRSGRSDAFDKVEAEVSAWLAESSSRRLLILLDESDRFFEVDAPLFVQTRRFRHLGSKTQDRAKVVFAGLHSVQRFTKVASNSPFSHLAQRPTVIGPLRPQPALNLLTAPLAAMGYTFEEPDLVNRVLANCSYQPFLLQMFGHRLVERMHQQRRAAAPGQLPVPYLIRRADIDAVDANSDLREDISNAFRETLYLDPRYNVIANVMASHAHTFGLDARLSDTELREECAEWWPSGFAGLDFEAFRAYLAEMVGLGVLARNSDGAGWRLRGPAVLRMMGLPGEVEDQLLGAATSSLREEFVALEMHTLMADNVSRSPLTAAQMDDLIGDHTNQVRVVLGAAATAVDDVADAVAAAADIGKRFNVLRPTTRGAFDTALVGGIPGERRVVVSSLTGRPIDVCLAALDASLRRVPERGGVTRSTVLVADASQLEFWREVLSLESTVPELSTVALRRYDLPTLRVWALVAGKFRSDGRAERLLEVTGGWPFLVERAAARQASSAGEMKVMAGIETVLGTPDGAAELVAAVGVGDDPCVARVYNDLVDILGDDDADLADLQSAAGDAGENPEEVVACLLALGVMNPSGVGRHRLEPVLASAWRRRPVH